MKRNRIGHILRGKSLTRDVLEGRIEGKRPKGSPRKNLLDGIMEEDYQKLKEKAQAREDRRLWETFVN